MDLNRVRNVGGVWAIAAVAVLAACLPAAASEPSTSVAPAPGVPSHGRAWELTTSPESTGGATFWVSGVSLTPDGNTVLYENFGVLPDFPYGNPLFPRLISTRGPSGWSPSQPVGPVPSSPFYTVLALGPEGSKLWWVENDALDFSLYRQAGDGQFEKLAERGFAFLGASPDLRRVLFTSEAHFLPGDASRTQGRSIYERDGSGLRLLDVGSGGALVSDCGSLRQVASADARRVYFSAKPGCEGGDRLYLAELGAGVREVASAGDIVNLTRDGSSALIMTSAALTADDQNSHSDLYRYDAEDAELTLITSGPGRPDLVAADVPTGLGSQVGSGWVSANGSRTYFTAAESIGPAETGPTGVYVADADGVRLLGPTATTTLVDVSADGRYAVLNSTEPLAAGDSDGLRDVYRYDAVSDGFTRISKGSVGGDGELPAGAEADVSSPEGVLPGPAFRAISEDGSRIFFVTAERLVPEDTNGLTDVYEWADGDVGLISSGVGRFPATLLTATPDGASVLFKTADPLLARDRDGDDFDYYVARIGGGFAEPPPPADPCPCREPGPAREQLDGDAASPKSPAGHVALASIAAAERRRIARSGWIELLVEVPGSGRLSAEARARLGSRTVTVAATAVEVAEPGPVRLRMRLNKAARRHLAAGRGLALRLRVKLAGDPGAKALLLRLKGRR